jgi:hypothetical protein
MPIWGQLLIVFGCAVLALVLTPYIIKGILKLRLAPIAIYCLAVGHFDRADQYEQVET